MCSSRRLSRPSVESALFFIVLLFTASSVFSAQLAPLALVGILATFVARRSFLGRFTCRSPADLTLTGLAIVLAANSLVSVRPEITWPQACQGLVGIGFLYGLMNWIDTDHRLHLSILALAATGMLVGLAAPFTVDWIPDKLALAPSVIYAWSRSLSVREVHPNILAGALAVIGMLVSGLLVFGRRALSLAERTFLLASVLCMAIALLLTQSRGALIGVAGALLVMFILRLTKVWRLGVLASAIVCAIAITRMDLLALLSDTSESIRNLDGRLEIWRTAYEIIHDFPVTGIGLGNFAPVTDLMYPFVVAGEHQPHAHNMFLQVAVDVGIPGEVTWLSTAIVITIIAWLTYRGGKSSNRPIYAGLGAGVLCGQTAWLLHGLTDAALWNTRPAILLPATWGIALAAYIMFREPYSVQGEIDSTTERE